MQLRDTCEWCKKKYFIWNMIWEYDLCYNGPEGGKADKYRICKKCDRAWQKKRKEQMIYWATKMKDGMQ